MDSERHSLYNSLRMSWLLDPNMSVEPWQVEDYRVLPLQAVFDRLRLQGISLTRSQFIAVSEEFESPEDLLMYLITDLEVDERSNDQIYLLVFELWRRLLPEKPTLTIFCDELDFQIHQYDFGNLYNYEALQDTLENLQTILEENVDLGIDPKEAFELISSKCANNIEGFLYDFIAERLDENNNAYARELIEAFENYLNDLNEFDFLKVRLIYASDPEGAHEILGRIVKKIHLQPDLELNLEILGFLGRHCESELFFNFFKPTLALVRYEEDFKDLLQISFDFCQSCEQKQELKKIELLIKKRSKMNPRKNIMSSDPDLIELTDLMTLSCKNMQSIDFQ